MKCFLNEASFISASSGAAMLALRETVRDLESSNSGVSFHNNGEYLASSEWKTSFNHLSLPDPLSRAAIREMIFSSRYFRDWVPSRVSAPADIYECAELDAYFENDSQCEAAELHFRAEAVCLLLSAVGSRWAQFNNLQFKSPAGDIAQLVNLVDREQAAGFISAQASYYDPAAKDPPLPIQTVLAKQVGRFVKTGKTERNGGRQVYREVATGYFYYIDNLHSGRAAHFEVFDSLERHLGKGNIETGDIDASTRKKDRRIKW